MPDHVRGQAPRITPLKSAPARYGVVPVVVTLALLSREVLSAWVGSMPTYITFYPVVMLTAILGGFYPGLLATFMSALFTAYWVLPPHGSLRVERASDVVALVLFSGMGVFMSGLAGVYQRTQQRAAGLERDLAVRESEQRSREREEEALRRYELLAANSREIVLFLRRDDGRILEANAAATKAYGFSREELLARAVQDLRAPETQGATAAQMAVADDRGVLFETTHRRRDGSTFPVEVSSQGSTIGGVRTLISVVRDITDRKRAEAVLRESEARLRLLAEALPQLVWTADEAGRVDYFNGRWRDYTGQAEGAEDLESALHPDDRESVLARWRETVAQQEELEVEHRLRRADGEFRWFLRRAVLLGRAEGVRGRWFGTCTDIHDLKTSQDLLQQADRLKDDFISMASHEFRTPLTALRLQAALLGRKLRAVVPDERLEHQLSAMNVQILRLEGLLGTLLDVSRINAGRFTLDLASVDLAELACEVVERFRPEAEATGTELRVRVRSVAGRWDRMRLDQVITNLVSNAIKYGSRQPVEVEVEERGGAGVLVVRDLGIGIQAESLRRLFDRFERGANATPFKGLGLGLWIAKKMVDAHGGEISVVSAPGAGSTFTVTIPRSPPGSAA